MADLRIKDLVVEYSSGGYAVRPIDGLNLDVSEGSLAILLGPSGCGKTTPLSFLGGSLKPPRGGVAGGLALNPPLLLADEPTAHLDFIQVEEVLRLIRELAEGERVVVVATHDTRILPLADQVVELVPHIAAIEHEPETVELAKGEVLFEQGTVGDCIYVVSMGEMELVRELADG